MNISFVSKLKKTMSYKMKNNNYFGLATESRHISFDPSSWPITVRVPRTIPLAGDSDSKSSDWTSKVLSEKPMSTTGLWKDIVLITHVEQKYVFFYWIHNKILNNTYMECTFLAILIGTKQGELMKQVRFVMRLIGLKCP